MGGRTWDTDYLMRRFLGEHPSTAHEDPEPELGDGVPLAGAEREAADTSLNPNLMDLPEPRTSQNVFWSERVNEEHRLRQMRPDHLPELEDGQGPYKLGRGRGSERTAEENTGSMGTEALFMTAREMDRQTLVSRYHAFDALQFLSEMPGPAATEPEYFNMAAAVSESLDGGRDTTRSLRQTREGNRTGTFSERPEAGHELDSGLVPRSGMFEDMDGTLGRGRTGVASFVESSQGLPQRVSDEDRLEYSVEVGLACQLLLSPPRVLETGRDKRRSSLRRN